MNFQLKFASFLSILVSVITLLGCGSSGPVNYLPESKDAECIENISGKDYKYLAWGLGNDIPSAEVDALKSALWAAIYGAGAGSCVSLMNTTERENGKDYVNYLFSIEKEWRQYVRSSNQGRIDPNKRLKLTDGRIKLGIEAIVATKLLRESLEAKGIIGGMRIGK